MKQFLSPLNCHINRVIPRRIRKSRFLKSIKKKNRTQSELKVFIKKNYNQYYKAPLFYTPKYYFHWRLQNMQYVKVLNFRQRAGKNIANNKILQAVVTTAITITVCQAIKNVNNSIREYALIDVSLQQYNLFYALLISLHNRIILGNNG